MANQAVSILIDTLSVIFVALVFLTLVVLLLIVICLAVACSVGLYNYYFKKGGKMKLKEIVPEFDRIELYEYREETMLQSPQELDFETAVERYGDRKVYFTISHEDRQITVDHRSDQLRVGVPSQLLQRFDHG